jgi:molybdopterin/thiamine biosynthesis adenylyltransferase
MQQVTDNFTSEQKKSAGYFSAQTSLTEQLNKFKNIAPTEIKRIYRPLFYRLHQNTDKESFSELLNNNPNLKVFDQLFGQLKELIKTEQPNRTFTEAELDQLAEERAGITPIECGVWVYYPWSGNLVHLLDEKEFIELRTNRNHYKITKAEQARLAQKRYGIVGLSVGQSIAVTMAMERSCGELRLADFDVLELSNLNRIRTGLHNLDIPKVIATAREIAEIDPFIKVICFQEGITAANIQDFLLGGLKLDIVIDECDSLDIKLLIRHHARAANIPVVMDTSDRGLLDVERFDLEPHRPLFHGLIEELDPESLRELSIEDKVPYVLKITGIETTSTVMKASLLEVGQTITTWPQLASAVVLGGAVGADVCRRIALDQFQASGRFYIDLEELIVASNNSIALNNSIKVGDSVARPSVAEKSAFSHAEMLTLIEKVTPPQVSENEFLNLDPSQVVALVKAANLAPSAGNCQPWQWLYKDTTLYLFHNEARSANFLDYEKGAAYVALGAAYENLVLQAHSLNLEVVSRFFPLAGVNQLIAALNFTFGGTNTNLTELRIYPNLVDFIPLRVTNRNLGNGKLIDKTVLAQIKAAAESVAGAKFHLLENPAEIKMIAQLIGKGERLRMLHPQAHSEMMQELRWNSEEAYQKRDGIDIATLGLTVSDQAALQVCRDWRVLSLVKQWGGGGNLEKIFRRSAESASNVFLLTMPNHKPLDFFLGGRAVERAWLTANSLEVAFHPFGSLPYLFARLIRHDGKGFSAEMTHELRELRHQYETLFGLDNGMAELLLVKLAKTAEPVGKSLRTNLEQNLIFG